MFFDRHGIKAFLLIIVFTLCFFAPLLDWLVAANFAHFIKQNFEFFTLFLAPFSIQLLLLLTVQLSFNENESREYKEAIAKGVAIVTVVMLFIHFFDNADYPLLPEMNQFKVLVAICYTLYITSIPVLQLNRKYFHTRFVAAVFTANVLTWLLALFFFSSQYKFWVILAANLFSVFIFLISLVSARQLKIYFMEKEQNKQEAK